MKHEKQETVTRSLCCVTCDVCGARDDDGQTKCWTCPGCERDVCRVCATMLREDPFSRQWNGDHGARVCCDCFKRLGKYAYDVTAVHDQCDTALDMLERKWKEECRNGQKTA